MAENNEVDLFARYNTVEPTPTETPEPTGEVDLFARYARQGEGEPAPKEEQEPLETGFMDMFSGAERIAATPELGTLPEFGSTVLEEDNTFKVALGLLSTFDTEAQMQVIQEQIPGVVFEKTRDGSVIVESPTEEGGTRRSVLNRPGFSSQDAATTLTQMLAFTPAAKVAGLAASLTARVAAGFAGNAATEAAMQTAAQQVGRKGYDAGEIILAGVGGGIGEGVGHALSVRKVNKAAKKVDAPVSTLSGVKQNIKAAEEAVDATKIELTKGQKTLVPSTLDEQEYLGTLPEGMGPALKTLGDQNEQAQTAVQFLLDQIASPQAVVTGTKKIKTVAEKVIEAAETVRKERTSPLYNEALDVGADVDLNPIKQVVLEVSQDIPEKGEVAIAVKKAVAAMTPKDGSIPSIRRLHNAKLEIDKIISAKGDKAVDKQTAQEIIKIKDALVKQMGKASPLYERARQEFIKESPAVEELTESIIGKISKVGDADLSKITGMIFDTKETNPQVLLKTKKIIQDVDPGAWDEIVRTELQKRLGGVLDEGFEEGAAVQNIPLSLHKKLGFGDPQKYKIIKAALDPEARKNLDFLKTALERASRGRAKGSATSGRQQIEKRIRSGFIGSIRKFIAEPLETIAEVGIESVARKKKEAMAEALFDTKWSAEMDVIRGLSGEEAEQAMDSLLKKTMKAAAKRSAPVSGAYLGAEDDPESL